MVNTYFYFNQFKEQLEKKLEVRFQVEDSRTGVLLLTNATQPFQLYYYFNEAPDRVETLEKSCIHLDEDLCFKKSKLIVNRLIALTGKGIKIHGRDTVIARIDKKQSLKFQEEHHLHAALPGKYRYGLFHQGDLVAIAVFSGGRKMLSRGENYRSFELLRFCSKTNMTIVGGFTKLLRAFEMQFNPSDIMTYVDKDWSDSTNYLKLGFEIKGELAGQYFRVDPTTMNRYSDDKFPADTVLLRKKNSGSIKIVKSFNFY